MIFKLKTADHSYNDKDKERLEKLGFEFKTKQTSIGEFQHQDEPWRKVYFDEPKATKPQPTIEINALEELLEFIKLHGKIVVDLDTITIYDDYLE